MNHGESEQKTLSSLFNTIVILLISFILTTIVGGLLGHYFQERSWRNQHKAMLLESERVRATELFDELSRLIDQRLYRTRLLFSRQANGLSTEKIEPYWIAYREILYTWNDNLNRNLTMVERYFGTDMRNTFEYSIHFPLRDVGSFMEQLRSSHSSKMDISGTSKLIDSINNTICAFDNKMVQAIQEGKVGYFLENPITDGMR